MIELSPEEFINLLKSEEYAPYLLHEFSSGKKLINMKALPKTHYLPINGSYNDGYFFCLKLNEFSDQDMIEVRMRK